jgi:sulfite dehydrogenase
MKTQPIQLRGILVFACALVATQTAYALDISLPPETASYRTSDLPGYNLVQQNCLICHSANYVEYQPPGSSREYWDATVHKMKNAFKAPFPDNDIPAMVDYLAKTYGAERTAVTAKSDSSTNKAISPPEVAKAPAKASHDPQALLKANNCIACHAVDKKIVGPAFNDVAKKYANQPDAIEKIQQSIQRGGAGQWGPVPMPPFANLEKAELDALARWILKH